ncbi:MAG: 3-methyl-2-oxobutanoate dehydrogenase subunit VorB [Chitinivibrionales bacterium]|nr:3-methyl-2-oxobutanoate dehydrogenase subunit VorB [Chitinivibrionales bacterium]
MNRQLMKGNDAVVCGAILGGATHFFGYPITPASEIAHTAASQFPRAGQEFLQAESEVSSINMVYGAASAGGRAMTASSGPGISLMAEGISYLAGAELPAVIVDVQRAGPGLGNIWPEQSDYNCVVRGGGHGNYRNVVFAPNSVQEMCDFTYRAFDIADKFRIVVFILSDAYIGQMMEPVDIPPVVKHVKRHDWAVYGDSQSRPNLVTSIFMNTAILSAHNEKLQQKYSQISAELVECEEIDVEKSDTIFVAFGICSRICFSALQQLKTKGRAVGLFRPKTLFPFPNERLRQLAKQGKRFIVVELNNGMMADDVQLAINKPVVRYNWYGGKTPSVEEIIERVEKDRV